MAHFNYNEGFYERLTHLPILSSGIMRLAFVITLVCLAISAAQHTLAAEQPLLVAPPDAVQYSLGTPQTQDDRTGRGELVIPYTRTNNGEGSATLVGRSSDGQLQILGFSPRPDQASGEFRLRKLFSGRDSGGFNHEFYLVSPAHWAGKTYGQCLVSNVVRVGNPGASISARQWNAEEKAAYEKHLIGKQPPAGLPDGFVGAEDSSGLTPGMPIKAGYYGDWRDAELVSIINNALVGIIFQGEDRVTRMLVKDWVALDPEVLRRAASNPGQFKPSVDLLPGGTLSLPDDAVQLANDTRLLVGTPLLVEWAGKWIDAYVISADEEQVKVRYEGYSSSFDRSNPRSSYAIRRSTLEEMKSPDAQQRFAANLTTERKSSADAFPEQEDVEGGWARPEPKRFKEYKVTIDVPRRAQQVPEDLTLEPGTPLAACWARKWNPVTVLSENANGTVNIRWDAYGDAWDCSMKRDQLIIQDKTVRKLQRKYGVDPADLYKTVRTWTDASGQHRIEARLVSRTDTEVTLLTDKGRELTLPLEKLSQEDQALLAKVNPAVENPFE